MTWVLFAHVALGALWLGGVMYQEALTVGARKSGREEYVRTAIRVQQVNARIYPPVTILILLTAVWMIVARDHLGFGDLWITLSFTIWLIGVLTGIFYFTAKAKSLSARLEATGVDESLLAEVERVHMVERVEIILLLGLLFLMIFKPGA